MAGAVDAAGGRPGAVEHPNGPEVWAALLAELRPNCAHVETGTVRADSAADEAELDDTGVPWVPRLGGRAPLGAELEHVARTGKWDRSHYAGAARPVGRRGRCCGSWLAAGRRPVGDRLRSLEGPAGAVREAL